MDEKRVGSFEEIQQNVLESEKIEVYVIDIY